MKKVWHVVDVDLPVRTKKKTVHIQPENMFAVRKLGREQTRLPAGLHALGASVENSGRHPFLVISAPRENP
jgi:hypothetical protein